MEELTTLIMEASSPDIAKCQRQAAFGELIKRFQDSAYQYANGILNDPQLAHEATQEAFITAYQKLGQLREPEAFPGWLRRIVLTQCNRLKRKKRLPTDSMGDMTDIPSIEPDPAATIESRALKATVLAAIEALPGHEQVVVRLFYLQGYSLKEVAQRLKLPVTTIKKRLQYARRRLREVITQEIGANFMACRLNTAAPTLNLAAIILGLAQVLSGPGYLPVQSREDTFRLRYEVKQRCEY
jgi:RNA polymerase sigma factor (sigma-70 family)